MNLFKKDLLTYATLTSDERVEVDDLLDEVADHTGGFLPAEDYHAKARRFDAQPYDNRFFVYEAARARVHTKALEGRLGAVETKLADLKRDSYCK